MYETTYCVREPNSTWWIYIKLFVEIKPLKNNSSYNKINNKIGVRFADNPPNLSEKFVEEDMKYILNGLNIIKETLSKYINNEGILIEIKSIQFNISDFQEEGLTLAIIKLMSEIYGFEMPYIPVHFDKQLNKYIFEFFR
jgi:hypothetical protein